MGHHSHFDDDPFEEAPVMEVVGTIVGVIGAAVVLALLCKCCHANKNRGRVLQPPPAAVPHPPAPGLYPQQQYNTVAVPTAVGGHHVTVSYPVGGVPYPAGAAPYPTAGAPYPAVAPYPATSPYPTGAHMPQPAPPSAPDHHAFVGVAAPPAPPGWHPQALPPSYDQVMGGEATKHPPYNPYPH